MAVEGEAAGQSMGSVVVTQPPPDGEGRARRWRRGLLVTGIALAVSGAITGTVFAQVFDVEEIPSMAMEPAIEFGDRVVVRGISGDEVNRGDVVIVEVPEPGGPGTMQVVKRVIAVGGDEIAATPTGQVLLNGEVLDEPYLAPGTVTTDLHEQEVPDGHVFVMGDNRPNSGDSRRDGPVPNEQVASLVVSTWPPLPGHGF